MENQRALPWMTFSPNARSAFSGEVAKELAARHGLAPDNVLALGMDLLVAMAWRDQQPDDRLLKMQRRTGDRRRGRANVRLEQAEKAVAAAREELSGLAAADATVLGAFDRDPANWVARLDRIAAELGELHRALAYSARLEHALTDPSATDKRLNRDDIRMNVLRMIFLFWREQGRPLSVTTRPDRIDDVITGPLVDFARDVVAELTEPSKILSGETLKADLRKAKGQLDAFDARLPQVPPRDR